MRCIRLARPARDADLVSLITGPFERVPFSVPLLLAHATAQTPQALPIADLTTTTAFAEVGRGGKDRALGRGITFRARGRFIGLVGEW
ncbi:MAG: hypothetical protein JNL21_15645 [Myxococcales bacterium]|nr:hypothetical protein [Myxococcales bacterium]